MCDLSFAQFCCCWTFIIWYGSLLKIVANNALGGIFSAHYNGRIPRTLCLTFLQIDVDPQMSYFRPKMARRIFNKPPKCPKYLFQGAWPEDAGPCSSPTSLCCGKVCHYIKIDWFLLEKRWWQLWEVAKQQNGTPGPAVTKWSRDGHLHLIWYTPY